MNTQKQILPADPAAAVKFVTGIAQKLIDVMEQESRAMTMRDGVSFTAAQEEKEGLLTQYQVISQEFQKRILDFRGVDRALLDRLDSTQRRLKVMTLENSATMERMKA